MPNNRRVGREHALKILFGLKYDATPPSADALLEKFWINFRFADDLLGEPIETENAPVAQGVRLFTEALVRGVLDKRPLLDKQIADAAQNWSLTRMAPVDLTLLRIAVYELIFLPEIPVAVTLNEAIEIAKRYGTKESPMFINGLLDKVARNVGADRT